MRDQYAFTKTHNIVVLHGKHCVIQLYEMFCNNLSTKVTKTHQSYHRNLDIWFLSRGVCPMYSHDPGNQETPYVLHESITKVHICELKVYTSFY